MSQDSRRRFDAQVEGRLSDLRHRTESFPLDVGFADRVMLAVNGAQYENAWLATAPAVRSFLVCAALVALALGWALLPQGPSAVRLLATTTAPVEGSW